MTKGWIGYSQNIRRSKKEQVQYEKDLAASIAEELENFRVGETTTEFYITSFCQKWEEQFYFEEQLNKAEKAIQRFAWERYNWKRKVHKLNAKIAKLEGRDFLPTDLVLPKKKQSDFLFPK